MFPKLNHYEKDRTRNPCPEKRKHKPRKDPSCDGRRMLSQAFNFEGCWVFVGFIGVNRLQQRALELWISPESA